MVSLVRICLTDRHPLLSQLDAFPFLKLPREIRDQVYKYVLGNNFAHL